MEEKVIEILKEVLEDNNVNAETSQQNNANWDSMRHLNLVVELEMEFDVTLEPDEIAEMTSVEKVVETLKKK